MKEELFPEEVFRNSQANEVWKKKEVDRLLELYLGGRTPKRIAVDMKRNPKAIFRKLQEYINNERHRVENYEPLQRTSRKGMRMTENEWRILRAHRDKKIPGKLTARLLMREPSELGLDQNNLSSLVDMKQIGVGVDLVLAYRYLYYVQNISILSDEAYDTLEKEEKEFGGGSRALEKVGSDRAEDYPPHIRALAMYLAFKFAGRQDADKRVYAIGEKGDAGDYAMWYGPIEDKAAVMGMIGRSLRSRVLSCSKSDHSGSWREELRWSEKRGAWRELPL